MRERAFSREITLGGRQYKVEIYTYPERTEIAPSFTIARRKHNKPDGEWISSSPTYYWWHPLELPTLIQALQEVYADWNNAVNGIDDPELEPATPDAGAGREGRE